MDEQPGQQNPEIRIWLDEQGPHYEAKMNPLMIPSLLKVIAAKVEQELGIK
jgi:hypothetical protein